MSDTTTPAYEVSNPFIPDADGNRRAFCADPSATTNNGAQVVVFFPGANADETGGMAWITAEDARAFALQLLHSASAAEFTVQGFVKAPF